MYYCRWNRMKNILYIIYILIIITGCIKEPPPVVDNFKFKKGSNHYVITAKATRIRDHKTISLHIESIKETPNIAILIVVDNYTDAFHYKNLHDNNLISNDEVKFILISESYYESESGKLLIYSDNDKIIKGEFEFTGINAFDSTDIINVMDGSFEIDYSPSIAIERRY